MAEPDSRVENAGQPPPADTGSTYTSRPGVVTLICILTFIGAGWQVIQFAFFAAGRFQPDSIEFFVTLVVLGLFTGLPLAIGIGMWHARNWARILFVIVIPSMRVLDLVALPNPFSAFALAVVLVLAFLLLLRIPDFCFHFINQSRRFQETWLFCLDFSKQILGISPLACIHCMHSAAVKLIEFGLLHYMKGEVVAYLN